MIADVTSFLSKNVLLFKDVESVVDRLVCIAGFLPVWRPFVGMVYAALVAASKARKHKGAREAEEAPGVRGDASVRSNWQAKSDALQDGVPQRGAPVNCIWAKSIKYHRSGSRPSWLAKQGRFAELIRLNLILALAGR